jgi:DNA polymerase-3 subunit alpha
VIKDLTINPCRQLTDSLEEILNYKAVAFTKKPIELQRRKKQWEKQG